MAAFHARDVRAGGTCGRMGFAAPNRCDFDNFLQIRKSPRSRISPRVTQKAPNPVYLLNDHVMHAASKLETVATTFGRLCSVPFKKGVVRWWIIFDLVQTAGAYIRRIRWQGLSTPQFAKGYDHLRPREFSFAHHTCVSLAGAGGGGAPLGRLLRLHG